MAHNLHRRLDGTYQALYVGKPAWHNLGEVIADAQTAGQIYARVFNKRVITTVPAYAKIGRKVVEVPEFRFTADERAGTVFAAVSADYPPISDLTVLKMLEAIPKATRKRAAFVSAFTLGNGARAAATLDLTRFIGEKALKVIRDTSPLEAFLVADWSHDGKSALSFMDAVNRVDCNNMLNMARDRAEGRGRLVRIIHAGSDQTIEEQLREAENVLGFAARGIKASVKLLNEIAEIALPKPDKWFAEFTELVIPDPAGDVDSRGGRALTNRQVARDLMAELWQSSPTLVGVPKSPYRAFQVVAEYGDHYRPLRIADGQDRAAAERRFRSITEGPSADLKARAMELIRQEFEIKVPVLAK